jgi:hypothetical protein
MKTPQNPVLLAGALMLAFASSAAFAGGARPFEVDFDKCYAHDGPASYLFTFSGPVSGDVSGTVDAEVLVYTVGIQPNWTHIQADYVIAGSLPFTARVGGRRDDRTGNAVLDGYVSAGPAWLVGAAVHDEFGSYSRPDGTPCARGTLYITPRWKQTHNDD